MNSMIFLEKAAEVCSQILEKKYFQILDDTIMEFKTQYDSFYFFVGNTSWRDYHYDLWIGRYYINSFLKQFYYLLLKTEEEKAVYKFLFNHYDEVNLSAFDKYMIDYRERFFPNKICKDCLWPINTKFLHSTKILDINDGLKKTFGTFRFLCSKPPSHGEVKWNELSFEKILTLNSLEHRILKQMIDFFVFKDSLNNSSLIKPNIDLFKKISIENNFVQKNYNWRCESCENEIKREAEKFDFLGKACPKCRIIIFSNYCPKCGSKFVIPNFCFKCKKEVSTDFCGNCGNSITNLRND